MQKLLKLSGVIILLLMVTMFTGCIKLSLFSREQNYIVGSSEILERVQDLEERLDEMENWDDDCFCDEEDDDDDHDDDHEHEHGEHEHDD